MLRRVAGTELAAIICLIADLVCFKLLFYFSSLPFVSFILFITVYYFISYRNCCYQFDSWYFFIITNLL